MSPGKIALAALASLIFTAIILVLVVFLLDPDGIGGSKELRFLVVRI